MATKKTFYFFDLDSRKKISLKEGIIFGRAGSNDVCIADESVSGRHFKIVFVDELPHLVDLESFNKTYINDEPVRPNEPTLLERGDIVRAGNVSYSFNAKASKEAGDLTMPDVSMSLRFDAEGLDNIEQLDIKESVSEAVSRRRESRDVMQRLKESRKYSAELEETFSQVEAKINEKKTLEEVKESLKQEIESHQKAMKANLEKPKEYDEEVIKLQDKVSDSEKIIEEKEMKIKKILKELQDEIKVHSDIIDRSTRAIENFLKEKKHLLEKRIAEEKFEKINGEIGEYQKLELTEKFNFLQKEIRDEEKKYKELQEDWALSAANSGKRISRRRRKKSA